MAREAVYIRIVLEEMGHKQPPTPLQTDNAMTEAVTNGKVHKTYKSYGHEIPFLRSWALTGGLVVVCSPSRGLFRCIGFLSSLP